MIVRDRRFVNDPMMVYSTSGEDVIIITPKGKITIIGSPPKDIIKKSKKITNLIKQHGSIDNIPAISVQQFVELAISL